MRRFEATADIGPIKQARVVFDTSRGLAVVHLHDDNPMVMFLALSGECELKNVVLQTGTATFHADSLGPFHVIRHERVQDQPDDSFADSALIRAMGSRPELKAGTWLYLRPRNSGLDFIRMGEPEAAGSEILFHCPASRPLNLAFDCNGRRVSLTSAAASSELEEYVLASSTLAGIDEDAGMIRTALSLLLRRRVGFHVMRSEARFTLNLAQPDQTNSIGRLVTSEHLESAMQSLVDLVASGKIVSSAFHFLIEAFSNPATLEVRLLNAMVYLEIIDGSDTLAANALCSKLNIQRGDADLIVKVRNRMIHYGDGIAAALNTVKSEWGNRANGQAPDSQVLHQLFETDSPHGYFYAGLMDLFSNHLAAQANIPLSRINRRSLVSFKQAS